jgi:molecular chaperone DnaJ
VSDRDYYAELDVPKDASRDDIARAFRKMAAKYHPDRNPGDKAAEEKFKRIAEAYQVLSDPKSREAYDRGGQEQVQVDTGFQGFDSTEDVFSRFGDIFGDLFGDRVWKEAQPERGQDVEVELSISFEEAAEGGKKAFRIESPVRCESCRGSGVEGGRQEACSSCRGKGFVNRRAKEEGGFFSVSTPCAACGGTGRVRSPACKDCGGRGTVVAPRTVEVTIPSAIEDGTVLRLRGMGAPGGPRGESGDLLARVRVAKHPRFERDGLHLKARVTVDLPTAILGGERTVPLLRGEAVLTIPPGTQPGQEFRLARQGLRDAQGRRGDLFVRVQVEIPRDLTEEERRLVGQFRALRASRRD